MNAMAVVIIAARRLWPSRRAAVPHAADCTAPGFLDTSLTVIMQPLRCSARAPGGRGAVAVALDQPLLVVAVLEREQREAQLLDRLKRLHPEQLLLERADEALGTAVALGCGHERRVLSDLRARRPRLASSTER